MPTITATAEILIDREPTDVAGVMFDPHREPEWLEAVSGVEVIDQAVGPGARVKHTATLLGQPRSLTTAVKTFHFPHLLELAIDEQGVTGSVRYEVVRGASGSVARIRCRGDAPLLAMTPAGPVTAAVERTLQASLARLKTLLESPA